MTQKRNRIDEVRDAFARWSRMGNNKDGANMSTQDTMQDETIDAAQTEPEIGTEAVEADAQHAELEQLRGERDQLKDRLARLQAEFDNARKRDIKERQDARDYAVQGT